MLTVDTVRYQPVADKVTRRLHELLDQLVLVANHEGIVITSSRAHYAGRLVEEVLPTGGVPRVCVPLSFDSDRLAGKVIVAQSEFASPEAQRLTRALVEMVVDQVTAAEWLPAQAELKHKFIYDALHGRITDPDVLLRESQILGMDLSQPRSVILVNAADYIYPQDNDGWTIRGSSEVRARQRARFIISSIVGFFELPDDTICAYIGGGEIAVLKAVSRQTLSHWSDEDAASAEGSWVDLPALRRAATALLKRLQNDTRTPISIGIGRYHSGTDGLSRSYNDARIALTVGNRYNGPGRVHSIDDLGLAAFVGGADERTKRDLASYLLNPLQDECDLMTTLTTFFEESCSLARTARRLHIHRNTLGHRLQRVAMLVGLDPRDFEDAMQLRLALLVLSLPDR